MPHDLRIGTAGWSLPPALQERFPEGASHLERYAAVLDAAEINSTFHRSHRASTYERWAASVPATFAFSAKLPKAITHGARLASTQEALAAFLEEVRPLGDALQVLLVQLPPSLALEAAIAREFLAHLRGSFAGGIAVEPRHASWFTPEADRLLLDHQAARVAADPARVAGGGDPGGHRGLAYFRLHGSPRVYYSSYEKPFLEALAVRLARLREAGTPCWCIFDNTTLGAGTANALDLRAILDRK